MRGPMKELCQSDLGHWHGSAMDGASRAFWDARPGLASAWQTDREGRTTQKFAFGCEEISRKGPVSPWLGTPHLLRGLDSGMATRGTLGGAVAMVAP